MKDIQHHLYHRHRSPQWKGTVHHHNDSYLCFSLTLGSRSYLKPVTTMKLNGVVFTVAVFLCHIWLCSSYSRRKYYKRPVKPNIVFVLVDDLGWDDIGYHNPDIISPNLNKLANNGIKLDNYYVQPTCTPSRSQLLTGRHLIHMGFQHTNIKPMEPTGLPLDSPTLPEKLKESGYTTHLVGKWHQGHYTEKYLPTNRGFDSFYGLLTGSGNHFTHRRCFLGYCGYDLWNDTTPDLSYKNKRIYSTHLFTKKAAQLIRKHNTKKPMFLLLSLQAVHTPLKVPLKYKELYKNSWIPSGERRRLAGMVSCIDESIGYLITLLKKKMMWKNTVFVFSTDNGGSTIKGSSNWPLRGGKGRYWEGGIRGVGFVYSKLLKRNRIISRQLIHISDWFPTFVRLAGGSLNGTKDLAGYDQWKSISYGTQTKRKEILYNIDSCHYPHGDKLSGTKFDTRIKASIRFGVWKVMTGKQGRGHWLAPHYMKDLTMQDRDPPEKNVWMFNIARDPLERKDLSDAYPQKLRMILDRLAFYNKTAIACHNPYMDLRADPFANNGVWGPWM
ncbi:arylsulfatase B-like [Octopus vulgaris]|uniref:Arylsulfatase B-like n=2 Tax=Octopus vulgaris TaxID=6645 RepID=A0AA36F937_OCTVU|nr:arylsulfatase B-like [Octopus vulgaris]